MSGYRAAPVGATMPFDGTVYRRTLKHWNRDDGGGMQLVTGDSIYWSRIDALDSAAAACEAIGDARGAEAVRRLKETT